MRKKLFLCGAHRISEQISSLRAQKFPEHTQKYREAESDVNTTQSATLSQRFCKSMRVENQPDATYGAICGAFVKESENTVEAKFLKAKYWVKLRQNATTDLQRINTSKVVAQWGVPSVRDTRVHIKRFFYEGGLVLMTQSEGNVNVKPILQYLNTIKP